MALVAYEFSDESNAESEDDEKPTKKLENYSNSSIPDDTKSAAAIRIDDEKEEIILGSSRNRSVSDEDSSEEDVERVKITFSSLPKPNYHAFGADEIKIKNLKLTSLTKVTPILSHDLKNEPFHRQKLNFKKETGLLSVLPKPENENSSEVSKIFKLPSNLIPAVAKTPNTVKPKQLSVKHTAMKLNDDDEDIGTDFFSLSKNNTSEELAVDMCLDLPEPETIRTLNNFPQPNPLLIVSGNNEGSENRAGDEDAKNSQNLSDLDEEMIQKICGRKRKGQIPDNIQIIDINEAEILAESKKVASKHFTDEVMCSPAPKRSNSSNLSKRKHQITYLAFQAKENELELKNQWATNRATRKQTQSKYGF